MRTMLFGPVLLAIATPVFAQEGEPNLGYARKALDYFMDQRFGAPAELAGSATALLRRLKIARLDFAGVEKLLRGPRADFEKEPEVQPGRFTHRLFSMVCDHVDYETSYLLYVPRGYKPTKASSLVIVAHGGNGAMLLLRAGSAAYAGTSAWIREAEKHNFILAAPITQRGWGQIGNSVVLSLISKLQRRFFIDPDRIYVTGHSMGGHMTWRSALAMQDRWGAVAPMSGGYDFVKNESIYNLFNVSGYATYCTREPYGIDRDNKINGAWLKDQGFDWVSVQGRGSHTILMGEMPKVAKFFADHPRNMYPKRVYVRRGGRLFVDKAPSLADAKKRGWNRIEGWTGAHTWDRERPLYYGMSFWVRLVQPRPWTKTVVDDKGDEVQKPIVQTVWAENMGDNLIELTTSGVRRVLLYFHPKMIDFERPVIIKVNGKKVFEAKVERDLFKMLNLVQEFDDRGRIYHGMVDLKIADDAEVPVPKRQ